MEGFFVILAVAAYVLFFALVVWAMVSHVKEMRRQSWLLGKIARQLEDRGRKP